MTNQRVVLDPTAERAPPERALLPRPSDLEGLTVGLLDISKPRGDIFLDRLQEKLNDQGIAVKRFCKPTFTRTAPPGLMQEIVGDCDLVVEGLAD